MNYHATSLVNQSYDLVIHAAGFYGGLMFNRMHGSRIYWINQIINANVCEMINRTQPGRFIAIGSACIYPATCSGTMYEYHITGNNFHPSVKYSAQAKQDLLHMTQHLDVPWEYLVLGNVYGPTEHLSPERSHVVGSLVRKLCESTDVLNMIGTGRAVRDLLYIDDAAECIVRYAELSTPTRSVTNISSGKGYSIQHVTEKLLDFSAKSLVVNWGDPKDDGMLHKVLDNTKMIKDIDYHPQVDLDTGLMKTWQWINNS